MKNRASIPETCVVIGLLLTSVLSWSSSDLHLAQRDVLETHGLSVVLFHNEYHRGCGDQKMNGMEIILHDQRIATRRGPKKETSHFLPSKEVRRK